MPAHPQGCLYDSDKPSCGMSLAASVRGVILSAAGATIREESPRPRVLRLVIAESPQRAQNRALAGDPR